MLSAENRSRSIASNPIEKSINRDNHRMKFMKHVSGAFFILRIRRGSCEMCRRFSSCSGFVRSQYDDIFCMKILCPIFTRKPRQIIILLTVLPHRTPFVCANNKFIYTFPTTISIHMSSLLLPSPRSSVCTSAAHFYLLMMVLRLLFGLSNLVIELCDMNNLLLFYRAEFHRSPYFQNLTSSQLT